MAHRVSRNLSETSEDADDPSPVLQSERRDSSFSEDAYDPPPTDINYDDDNDSDDHGVQPMSTPSMRLRGVSSHSEDIDYESPTVSPHNGNRDIMYSIPTRQTRESFRSNSTSADSGGSDQDDFNKPRNERVGSTRPGNVTTKMPSSFLKRKRPSFLSSTSADSVDTDQEEEPVKTSISTKAMKMMASMGYKKGEGLGKKGQGIVEPIAESNQRGRRGFGLTLPAIDTAGLKYDPSLEVISVKEHVYWLDGPNQEPPSFEDMQEWMVIDKRKKTIDDETHFCAELVLDNVLKSKSVFDSLDGKELMKARSRANPFELIRGVFFLNRAAMKMANMDAVFDFMFTNPKDRQGRGLGPYDILYFADVCAGPGGFSEYVLWKKKWLAKGIGFTLKGANDFRLADFYAGPPETFEPFYGINDDGDVYNPANIISLYERVLETTYGEGVHFMMADGGFSVEGQENLQEVLSKRLYLCQCLVALRIVRVGGHFVVKLFDLFTPFSVGLIYLMYRCFDRISLHKPNTSRPANSERYLICESKRDNCEGVVNYMSNINQSLADLDNTDNDVMEIIPMDILKQPDSDFYTYIVNSNNSLGERQVVQLLKISAFCNNPMRHEPKQYELRKECLELYRIPDKTRAAPPSTHSTNLVNELLERSFDKLELNTLGPEGLEMQLYNVRDWMCCVIGSKKDDEVTQPTLFVSLGGSNVNRYVGRGQWVRVSNMTIELPRKTLILGEVIHEFEGGRGNQKRVSVLHIIDAAWLGDVDIRKKPFKERLILCQTFAKAVHRIDNVIIAKPFSPLPDLRNICDRLECKENKNGTSCLGLTLPSGKFLKPGGLLCVYTKGRWNRCFSRSAQKDYWYNRYTKQNVFELPRDAFSNFEFTIEKMKIWWWDEGVKMRSDQQFRPDPKKLQPRDILDYIQRII